MSTLSRKERILSYLRTAHCSTQFLASCLNCPDASVRRDIQALRREGHNILSVQDQYRLRDQVSQAATA